MHRARGQKQATVSCGASRQNEVGDFVVVTRGRKNGALPKRVRMWAPPKALEGGFCGWAIENIVTGKRTEVQVARMKL